MGLLEVLKLPEVPTLGLHGGCHGVSRSIIVFHGLSRSLTVSHGLSRFFTVGLGGSCLLQDRYPTLALLLDLANSAIADFEKSTMQCKTVCWR
jgi:hypothetical protein